MALDRRRSFILLISAFLVPLAIAIGTLHFSSPNKVSGYRQGDPISLFANTVRPSDHPCDSQPYFELPVCPPRSTNSTYKRKKYLEEIISGDCFKMTQHELKFMMPENGEIQILCEKNLTKDEVAKFRYAVKNNFEYQMFYVKNNGLRSFKGQIGRKIGNRYYLFHHAFFHSNYWEKQLETIVADEDTIAAVDITEDAEIKVTFTYSVAWDEAPADRAWFSTKEQEGWPIKEQEIWLNIILSLVYPLGVSFGWVKLLLAVAARYLTVYVAWHPLETVEGSREGVTSERINVDASTHPPYSCLIGAVLGNGTQAIVMICALFGMSYKGILHPCYSSIVILWLYCVTSVVSGYKATSFHGRYCAHGWKESVFQTGAIYLIPALISILYTNGLQAIHNHGLDLYEISISIAKGVIWGTCIIIFLTLGTMIDYFLKSKFRSSSITEITDNREVLQLSRMSTRILTDVFVGGLIPFMTIFFYMDEIYASLLKQKVCHAFGTLLSSFITVIITTILVGMALTYYQLSKGDLQWWWRSVLRGGSTAIFMFAYGIYIYLRLLLNNPESVQYSTASDAVADTLAKSSFISYNACIFYAFFLALGTVGFYASSYVFHPWHPGLKRND